MPGRLCLALLAVIGIAPADAAGKIPFVPADALEATQVEVRLPQHGFQVRDNRMDGAIFPLFEVAIAKSLSGINENMKQKMLDRNESGEGIEEAIRRGLCPAVSGLVEAGLPSRPQPACSDERLQGKAMRLADPDSDRQLMLDFAYFFNFEIGRLRIEMTAVYRANASETRKADVIQRRVYQYDISFAHTDKAFAFPAIEDRRFPRNKIRLWFGIGEEAMSRQVLEGARELTQMFLYDLKAPSKEVTGKAYSWYEGKQRYRALPLLDDHGDRVWFRLSGGDMASVLKFDLERNRSRAYSFQSW